MNQTPTQQLTALSNIIIGAVSMVLVSVLGIQIQLLAVPVYNRDKRFNQ